VEFPRTEPYGGPPDGEKQVRTPEEAPSSYCPVCSRRLEARKCKLLCSVCGYYMSCSDYY